jgi:hypothetical protein
MRNQLVVDLALDRTDPEPVEADHPDDGLSVLRLQLEDQQSADRRTTDLSAPNDGIPH